MNIAILTISSLSLCASLGTLYFMHKTSKNVKTTTDSLKAEVETVKTKVGHNANVVKAALRALEI